MKVIQYHGLDGTHTGLELDYESKKFIKILIIHGTGLKVRKVPITERQYVKELVDYGIPRAKRHLRHFAKTMHGGLRGVSSEVREAIR